MLNEQFALQHQHVAACRSAKVSPKSNALRERTRCLRHITFRAKRCMWSVYLCSCFRRGFISRLAGRVDRCFVKFSHPVSSVQTSTPQTDRRRMPANRKEGAMRRYYVFEFESKQ